MKIPAGIVALIVILAVRYAAGEWFRNHLVSMTTSNASSCLEILGNTTTEEEGQTFIIGSIKNNCDRSFGQVTILFKLDRTGGPMENLPEGVAYAYGRDVKAGELREFKTALPISKNSTYRFDGINAY
jgi:hypothetical protein